MEISSGNPLEGFVAKHLQECKACQEFKQYQDDLALEIKHIGDHVPSSALSARIRNAVVRPRMRLVPQIGYLTGVGASALALAVVFFASSGAKADAAYRRMKREIAQVRSVHFSLFAKSDAGESKVYELWWKPGAWREKASPADGGDRIKLVGSEGVQFYRYDEKSGTVKSMKELEEQPSEFSLEAVASRFMDTPDKFETKMLDGKTEQITVSNKGNWSRIVFFVDAHTHLPNHGVKEFLTDGTWKSSGHFDFEFDKAIPGQMFEPNDLSPRP